MDMSKVRDVTPRNIDKTRGRCWRYSKGADGVTVEKRQFYLEAAPEDGENGWHDNPDAAHRAEFNPASEDGAVILHAAPTEPSEFDELNGSLAKLSRALATSEYSLETLNLMRSAEAASKGRRGALSLLDGIIAQRSE